MKIERRCFGVIVYLLIKKGVDDGKFLNYLLPGAYAEMVTEEEDIVKINSGQLNYAMIRKVKTLAYLNSV